jgi:hypothetical protein
MNNTKSEVAANGKKTLISVGVNIVAPVLVLMTLSGEARLGPVAALVFALSFPLFFGFYELIVDRRVSFFAIIGFVGIFLTGGVGLLHLSPKLIAIKEGGVPFLVGIVIIAIGNTKWSVIEKIMQTVLDYDQVMSVVAKRQGHKEYKRLLKTGTYIVSFAFFVSAILNYILATKLVVSDGGTEAFNNELGRLTALSFPIIAIPTFVLIFTAMWYVLTGLRKLTGLDINDMLR